MLYGIMKEHLAIGQIFLKVESKNEHAINLYKKLGFERCSEKIKLGFKVKNDCISMIYLEKKNFKDEVLQILNHTEGTSTFGILAVPKPHSHQAK